MYYVYLKKSEEIRAQLFRKMPQAYHAVLPRGNDASIDSIAL